MNPDQWIVDASVAIKWLVPEIHTADALRLRNSTKPLHAPALLDVELGNVLWKKVRRGELTAADISEMVKRFLALPLVRHPIQPLVSPALDLACETGRTVYDSLYVALAVNLGGRMVTADRRLVNALANTPYATHVCWVEDVP